MEVLSDDMHQENGRYLHRLHSPKPPKGNKGRPQDQRNPSNGNGKDARARDLPPCDEHTAENDNTAKIDIAEMSRCFPPSAEDPRMDCSRPLRWMGFEAETEAKRMTHK
jgi:hypothetical protein